MRALATKSQAAPQKHSSAGFLRNHYSNKYEHLRRFLRTPRGCPMSRRGASKEAEARLLAILEIDLDAEKEPPPPAWSPEVGERLIGEFLGWVERDSQFGGQAKVALIQANSGARYSVWCASKGLKYEMEAADPKPGDAIAIVRREDRDTGKEFPLKRFQVAVDRNNGSPPRADESVGGGAQ